MRRVLSTVVVVLLVAACSGGGSGGATPGATQAATAAASVAPTIGTGGGDGGGANQATFRPSGAKVRVANFYQSAPNQPSALDIYGGFSAQSGPLLATVQPGTISDWFDPGVVDDQGDADLTFYPAGKSGPDDRVGDQTATLKGTERITIAIGTGDNTRPSGLQFAQWKTFYENGTDYPLPTAPAAGQAVLMADGVALIAFPGVKTTFAYLGVDGACLPSVEGGEAAGGQPFGPRSQQSYIFPAGRHTVSLHLDQPDCRAASAYPDVTVDLKAGEQGWLFFYSPDGKALKTLLVKAGS